jgi:hypothetical protein
MMPLSYRKILMTLRWTLSTAATGGAPTGESVAEDREVGRDFLEEFLKCR